MDKAAVTATVRQIPVHQVEIKDLYLASEALEGSNLSVRNSSQGGPLTDTELKASLAHIGLIYPLVFKVVDSKFYVVVGNRRLRFLREIYADRPDALIECQNVADYPVDWREIAIDTNLSLPPHPVERYEQIVAIASDLKMTPEDVRERFGLSHRQYMQIMALGSMAPEIREEWKEGRIDFKTAQAFTLEPDHKEQSRIYAAVAKANGGRVYEHGVRMKIVPPNQAEAGKMVEFLGIEFCREQKLLKQEDFFQANHIVTDLKELKRIFDGRLNETCAALQARGWSWAIPESAIPPGDRYNYHQVDAKKVTPTKAEATKIKELKKRIDDEDEMDDAVIELDIVEEEINLRGYTDEHKSKTGCLVSVNYRGKLEIKYGVMKPTDRRKIEASERSKNKSKATDKSSKSGEPVLNNSLASRLSEGLQEAIALAMKETPHVAVASLIAAAGSGGELLDVRVKDAPPKFEAGEKDFLQLFAGAAGSTANQQIVMLTQVAMQALDIVTHSAQHMPLQRKSLQVLIANLSAGAVNRHIAATFDAEDYFKGVSLDVIAAAVRDAIGDDLADKVAKMKKADAVKFAVEHLPKKGWLPAELRTIHYKGPAEKAAAQRDAPAKAVKAKKAAPAKKATKSKKKG